jgi:hypothetical protein
MKEIKLRQILFLVVNLIFPEKVQPNQAASKRKPHVINH